MHVLSRIAAHHRTSVAATLRRALPALALAGLLAGTAACTTGSPAASGSAAESAQGSTQATTHTAADTTAPDFRNTDIGCDWEPATQLQLDYAQNFTVDEYDNGCKLVCIKGGERFLVVPEDQSAPDGLAADVAVIQQPADSVYLVSTGMICLLDEIGALDRVTVASVTPESSPNDNLTQALEDGTCVYGGKYSAPDFELIAERGCTLAIENTKINHAPEVKQKLQDLGVTVLTEQSSTEPEVLGRLEWIRLMGVLFDCEDQADEVYQRIAARVEEVAAQEPTGKTVAFFYINDDGAAVTRRSNDYFSQMIEMAGGTFLSFDPSDEDEEASSSVQAVIDLETFYAEAKDADVIIYNTTVDASVTSIADLTAKNPLLADFRAVQDGQVYACDEDMYQAMTSMDDILGDIRGALLDTGENAGFIWKLS